jgi:hypothetical protein
MALSEITGTLPCVVLDGGTLYSAATNAVAVDVMIVTISPPTNDLINVFFIVYPSRVSVNNCFSATSFTPIFFSYP